MGEAMRGLGGGIRRACGVIAMAGVLALAVLMGAAPAALAAEAGTTGKAAAAGAGEEVAGSTADATPVATAEAADGAADSPRADAADQGIYAIFYKNSDGQSYTLVIQNGDALDPAYPKPADDLVMLVCNKDSGVSGTCDCLYNSGMGVSEDVRCFTTGAVVKEGVRPHCLNNWFAGFGNMETIDLNGLDTSEATTMAGMFSGCETLRSIDLSKFDTSKVTDVGGMFYNCSAVQSLDLSSFDTSKAVEMHFSDGSEGVFEGCSSLMSLTLGESFDTGSATNLSRMFSGCSSLKSIDLSRFDTSNVTDMNGMFRGCSSLKAIDLSGFDTAKVTDMSGMFSHCSSIKSLSFPPAFKTGWVTNMATMFSGCSSLEVLDLSSFDVARVRNMNFMLHFIPQGTFSPSLFTKIKVTLPAKGDFSKATLSSGFLSGTTLDALESYTVKWRNEKGEVFAADAIPAHTAGTYTAVLERSGSGSDGSGNGNSNGNGSGSNNGSGNGSSSGSGNDSGNGNGSGPADPAPKRTVAFSEAVALPLDATGVAMDKDDIVRDLAKRFGTRDRFPADASSVGVTIMRGGKEVETIDPRRAGTYEVTAVYSMPDGTERVIEAVYTVADPAAKAPVKATAKSTTRLAQTGDEVPVAVPLATAALAACALATAVAARRCARG